MGVDLTLAPMKYAEMDWWLAHERLKLDRNYELQDQIKELPSHAIEGKRLDWYEDEGIKERTADQYGTPLRFVYASEFRKIDTTPRSPTWNTAVLTFLQALPPETPVILWWH